MLLKYKCDEPINTFTISNKFLSQSHNECYRLVWLIKHLVCKQHIISTLKIISYENLEAINQTANRIKFIPKKKTIKIGNIFGKNWKHFTFKYETKQKVGTHKTTLTLYELIFDLFSTLNDFVSQ